MLSRRTLAPVLPLTAIACFAEPNAETRDPHLSPRTLTVSDRHGARYEPHAAPRDLELTLSFDDAPPSEPPVTLVRGALSPTLAMILAASRGRGAWRSQSIALDLTATAGSLVMHPRAPLAGGDDYTLLWLGSEPTAFPLSVARHPALGARFAASLPSAGESGVATNVVRMLVTFEGHLAEPLILALHGPDGVVDASVDRIACEQLGLAAGDCAWLVPSQPLLPNARYTIRLEGELKSATGAPLASPEISFESGAVDVVPPALAPLRCAPDELALSGCCVLVDDREVRVRGVLDEPARVSLLSTELRTQIASAREFSIRAPVAADVLLRCVDAADNTREATLKLAPPLALARVEIDEVRADPLGREPAQEYVELVNRGADPVSLDGFTLTSDASERGRMLTLAGSLGPHERMLAVAPDFARDDAADGTLPGAVRIARLDRPLSLANGGGDLFLRDASGRRLSHVIVRPALVEGQCAVRSPGAAGQRGGSELVPDPHGACTPGAPTFSEP
jgi:hypothetical protein